ncbi:MAG TPA: CPBP family intramembrane glutamic endopeptidase [Anaerovoracaceae bacterium]|nr:CPBP family intramembrane glutamic endopeptidase [Anaerovoracaceae bacterium]
MMSTDMFPKLEKRNINYKITIFITILSLLFWHWVVMLIDRVTDIINIERLLPYKLGIDSNLFLWFIILAIAIPVLEEVVFRGVIYGNLRKKFKQSTSVIIVSLLCAVFYLPFGFSVAMNIAVLSGMYACIYQQFGRLNLTIFYHSLSNVFFVLLNVEVIGNTYTWFMDFIYGNTSLVFWIELTIIMILCRTIFDLKKPVNKDKTKQDSMQTY